MVVGLLKPTIILPSSVKNYSQEKIIAILEHEKAHLARFDIQFSLIQKLITSIFWWNPVLRAINFEINLNRELACDQRAINQGTAQKYYAQLLMESAKEFVSDCDHGQSHGFFSKKSLFTTRLEEVLTMKSKNISNLFSITAACCLLCFGTITAVHSSGAGKDISDIARHAQDTNTIDQRPTFGPIPDWLEKIDEMASSKNITVESIRLHGPAKTTVSGVIIGKSNNARELVKQYMFNLNAQHGMDVKLSSIETENADPATFVIELPVARVNQKIVAAPLVKGLQITEIYSTPIWASFKGISPTRNKISALMRQIDTVSSNVSLKSMRISKDKENIDFELRVEPPIL